MKSYLLLLTFAILLASCSSVYQSGQTPDDVYFSPERQRDEYVRVENRQDKRYQYNELDREDRYLRMKVANRRYGLLDDYDFYTYNGPGYYNYADYHRINSYAYYRTPRIWNKGYIDLGFNPYYYNPYYCTPYYSGVVYGNTLPKYNKPRTSNLHVFDANGNVYNPNVPSNKGRTYSNEENYRGSGTNAGGFLRDAFKTGSSSSSNTERTSSGTSSGSSGSSSSSSESSRAPVRKF